MKETNLKIFRFLQELKSKNVSISYNDPEVFMGLQDLKLDDIKYLMGIFYHYNLIID